MSLLLLGKVLDVSDERRGKPGNEFVVTMVSLMVGKARIERVELAREFQGARPAEGDEVALQVSVRAFSGQRGPGYSFTAWEDWTQRVAVDALPVS